MFEVNCIFYILLDKKDLIKFLYKFYNYKKNKKYIIKIFKCINLRVLNNDYECV